jgi:hypothetical protein
VRVGRLVFGPNFLGTLEDRSHDVELGVDYVAELRIGDLKLHIRDQSTVFSFGVPFGLVKIF